MKYLEFLLILTFMAVLWVHAEDDCVSNFQGMKCLKKSEVGGFAIFMKGGDPCFLYRNKRVNIFMIGSEKQRTLTLLKVPKFGNVLANPKFGFFWFRPKYL